MEKYITKDEFNNLNVREQVKLFNKLIHEQNLTISKCCRNIGISYSTIRDRFKANNYVFNRYLKQYENVNESLTYNEDKLINQILNKLNEKSIKKLELNPSEKIINRSFGIDAQILNRFLSFCNKSSYKQYDILSKFIEEGLSKYEKVN